MEDKASLPVLPPQSDPKRIEDSTSACHLHAACGIVPAVWLL